jgi:LacI family transcriptional regulator/LacI family asc operon transcriptional repressor
MEGFLLSIHQVAEACGVSVATVSRVINNSPNVSAQTREKVLRAIQEVDYVPNAFASGYGRNAMKMVGILCVDISNLYYASAVALLERGLRERGFDSLLCCTGRVLGEKKKYLAAMLQKRMDAIVLVGSAYREERDNTHIREAASQVPVFMVNAHVQIPNVFCVLCDEKEAMRSSVHRLVKAGHRDIAYLHDMEGWAWAGSHKLAGFREGLTDCGITETPYSVQTVKHDLHAAQERIAALLEQNAGLTGILASEDLLAIGAQKAALAAGRDIAIIGFNNSSYAQCCTPALSSVDNMLETICPLAVDMLARFFEGEKIPNKVVVSATFIERETFRVI